MLRLGGLPAELSRLKNHFDMHEDRVDYAGELVAVSSKTMSGLVRRAPPKRFAGASSQSIVVSTFFEG